MAKIAFVLSMAVSFFIGTCYGIYITLRDAERAGVEQAVLDAAKGRTP